MPSFAESTVDGRIRFERPSSMSSLTKPWKPPPVTWRIPYFRHALGEAELACLASVLQGEILTTGDAVSEFEAKFAAYLGVRHALGVTSSTGPWHGGAAHGPPRARHRGGRRSDHYADELRCHRHRDSGGGRDTRFRRRRARYRQSRCRQGGSRNHAADEGDSASSSLWSYVPHARAQSNHGQAPIAFDRGRGALH